MVVAAMVSERLCIVLSENDAVECYQTLRRTVVVHFTVFKQSFSKKRIYYGRTGVLLLMSKN